MTDASSEVLSRRQILRGDIRGKKAPKRPPWSVAEALFVQICTRCDACLQACEEGVLYRGSGGYPEISFANAGCTFCGDCLKACEPEALSASHPAPSLAWDYKAKINPSCMSMQGIVCRACGDACDTDAIRFHLQTGGRAIPEIELERCNGCGECYAICPSKAVEISSNPNDGQRAAINNTKEV